MLHPDPAVNLLQANAPVVLLDVQLVRETTVAPYGTLIQLPLKPTSHFLPSVVVMMTIVDLGFGAV